MDKFPKEAKFIYPWRPYQAKVLSDLESHLDDDHLNVVAAPGSGKTVLGLEVMLRINHPTLILAPTLAIRNQWIDRFTDLFLNRKQKPDWISMDIKNPAFVTVCTYQSLHSSFRNTKDTEVVIEEEEQNGDELLQRDISDMADSDDSDNGEVRNLQADKIIELLKTQGLKTIILDEAHHLRNEWWKSLQYLKESMESPQMVALTATPPYDVEPHEWTRYQEMSGPIDTEISVPELVLEKNLCPHQDYVFLNSLSLEENKIVGKYREGVKEFMGKINEDNELISILGEHPHILEPDKHISEILSHPAYYSAIIIYLNKARGLRLHQLLKVLGVSSSNIPSFSLEWAEALFAHLLYRDTYLSDNYKNLLERIKKELRIIGAIERRSVYLKNNKVVKKLLKSSVNKLNSISTIVKEEDKNLAGKLRLVILADYIRKDLLNQKNLSKFGVIPIFEKLRRDNIGIDKLGVLTGSIIIIPTVAEEALYKVVDNIGIDRSKLTLKDVGGEGSFKFVNIAGDNNHMKVQIITELFTQGHIQILVGTASLLGEGWDAPSVNTLILASYVGSFMFSNQMRGRAIRVNPTDPNKVANIWHLVSVEDRQYPGTDYETLKRRFKAFVGLSFKGDIIENGFKRMDMPELPLREAKINKHNDRSMSSAKDRDTLASEWDRVLKDGDIKDLVQEVESPSNQLPRAFVFFNTLKALVWRGILIAAYIVAEGSQGPLNNSESFLETITIFGAGLLIVLIISLPWLLKALYLFLKNAPVTSSMRQIGEAVLYTLFKTGYINTNPNKMRVNVEKGEHGVVFCNLEGGTTYEKSLFLDSIEDILNPIENPRYLIVRKTMLGRFTRKDFHSVPNILDDKKKHAEYFSKMWGKYVGSHKLVYTRRPEGRKLLIKARYSSLASAFQKRSERLNKWK